MEKESRVQKSKVISGPTLVVVTVAVLLFGCLIFSLMIPSNLAEKREHSPIVYEGQPRLGNSSAPVKIMEFADFKCPACKTFHHKVLPKLRKEFIDTGKVQMYFTNFQWMGDDSIFAGEIGESIYHQNNELFWKYYDVIYANQKDEHENWATPEYLFSLVEEKIPEVDVDRVLLDLDSSRYEKTVLDEVTLARKLKIEEVPALFINGKKIKNPLDYNEIRQVIEDELR